MQSRQKFKRSSSFVLCPLRPSFIFIGLMVLFLALENSPVVHSESAFVPNPYPSFNPEVFRVLQHSPHSQAFQNTQGKQGRQLLQGETETGEPHHQNKPIEPMDKDRGNLEMQDGGSVYGDQQVHQLFPKGFLFSNSKQLVRPNANSIIFNQENGDAVSAEAESRFGLFPSLDDYDLSSKYTTPPRGGRVIYPHGPLFPVKRQSLAAREGYMCHFKLCQFGNSGKRGWY